MDIKVDETLCNHDDHDVPSMCPFGTRVTRGRPRSPKLHQGFCWNGQICVPDQASVNAGRGVHGTIAMPESMAALLVMYILSHMF